MKREIHYMNNKQYLREVSNMNKAYEHLLHQMRKHGFGDTLLLLSLVHKSFTQDILKQIKKTNTPFF